MKLTYAETQLKKVACFLGIIQGLGYGVLALICIILYNRDVMYLSMDTYMEKVQFYIYGLFLTYDVRYFPDQILYPRVFAGFAWVYIALSLLWLAVSIHALIKSGAALPKHLTAWSHLTLFISCWDLVTVIILGVDYHRCQQATWWIPEEACANGILPVLVIAARGFALWFVNVTLALILNKVALRLKREVRTQVMQAQMMQPAVQTPHGPLGYSLPQHMSQPNLYVPDQNRLPYNTSGTSLNRNQYEYPAGIPEPDYYYRAQPSPRMNKY